VIETFIIDWPVLIALGMSFGLFAPEGTWHRSRAFLAGLASAAAFTLVAMLSFVVAPDWMFMYFIEPSDASWIVPLIPVAYVFCYVLAFAGAVGLRALSRAFVWAAVGWSLVMEIAIVGLTWDRYHLVGTAGEWVSGDAHELFSATPEGAARWISLMSPVFLIVLAAAFVWVWRDRSAPAADR
jgi:hypothetical protein